MDGQALPTELADLRRRYEAAGGHFDLLLQIALPFVDAPPLNEWSHAYQVPPRITRAQRRRLIALLGRVNRELRRPGWPRQVGKGLRLIAWRLGTWASEPLPARRAVPLRARGRPRGKDARAATRRLVVAILEKELRERFQRPAWADLRTLLCAVAPADFSPLIEPTYLCGRLRDLVRRVPKALVDDHHRWWFSPLPQRKSPSTR